MTERVLPLTGAWNTRDLGGFAAAAGKRVAWGRLFRSDGLDGLTRADKACLATVPIKTVVDFRSEEEQTSHPDRLPETVERYLRYPIVPGSLTAAGGAGVSSSRQARTLMESLYVLLVTEEVCLSQYRRFFAVLQEGSGLPLLFHCSAGKDRTGLAAALILHALGVDGRDIMRDYLASATCLAGKYPSNEGVFSVAPEYLRAAEKAVVQEYGSVTAFLEQALDVDVERMRALFLE